MISIRFIQALVFSLFFYQCLAQLGTVILSPEHNATVIRGEKVDIQYTYGNMGNGSYSVNVELWKDNAAEELAETIDSNVHVESGTSGGVKNEFRLNATYEWKVPKGLDGMYYLTVTTKSDLQSQVGLAMRSSPVLIHVSSALSHLPIQKASLFGLAMVVVFFIC